MAGNSAFDGAALRVEASSAVVSKADAKTDAQTERAAELKLDPDIVVDKRQILKLEKLGHGTFGNSYKCLLEKRQLVVAKRLRLDEIGRRSEAMPLVSKEIALLR